MTPAGLVEGLWIKVPKINIKGVKLPNTPIEKIDAIFQWAREKYAEQLSYQYLEKQIRLRLDATQSAPAWCQKIANDMLAVEEISILQRKVSSILAWAFVNQYDSNDIEFDRALGFYCLESLKLGNSIDFFRLGDRVYWKEERERLARIGEKAQKAHTKIEDHKDLLDSELCQLLIIGDCKNGDNKIQVVTRDYEEMPRRLTRCMAFFDTLLSTAKQNFQMEISVPDDPFGTLVVLRPQDDKLVAESVEVKDFLARAFKRHPFTPKYFKFA